MKKSNKWLDKYQFGNGGNVVIPKNDIAKQWQQSYINSPKYKERLIGQGYENPDEVVSQRSDIVSKLVPQYWNTPYSEAPTKKEEITGITTSSSNGRTPNRPIVNYEQADRLGISPSAIMTHEMSHYPQDTMSPNDLRELETRNKYAKEIMGNQPWSPEFSNKNLLNSHKAGGYEIKADMDAVRFMMGKDKLYDAGTQDFTNEHLQQAKEKYKNDFIFKRLSDGYSDEDLIHIMNKVAANKSSSSGLPIAKNGSEINPNESTISLPPGFTGQGYNTIGRNYSPAWGGSFNNGGIIPLQEINHLFNFTNYNKPQSGGWLSKYE